LGQYIENGGNQVRERCVFETDHDESSRGFYDLTETRLSICVHTIRRYMQTNRLTITTSLFRHVVDDTPLRKDIPSRHRSTRRFAVDIGNDSRIICIVSIGIG
jgi:hypothetical protein